MNLIRVYAVAVSVAILALSAPQLFAATCNQNSTLTRPVPMGVSGGNINDFQVDLCYGGTLGAIVQNSAGKHFILSAGHVFGRCNAASAGEAIVQPGLNFVGCSQISQDTVATLSKYTTLSFSGTNYNDSAIAAVVSGEAEKSIENIGAIASTTAVAAMNMAVEKMGSGTCLTSGQVIATDILGTTSECGATVSFGKLIEIVMANAPGDSGALVVTSTACPQAVGLLIGGESSENRAYAIPINTVLSHFSVSVVGGCTAAQAPATTLAQAVATPTADDLAAAKVVNEYGHSLLAIPGVNLVGVTHDANGKTVIEVGVQKITPEVKSQIPSTLGGFPVQIVQRNRIQLY